MAFQLFLGKLIIVELFYWEHYRKKWCLSPTQPETNLYSCGTSHMINEKTFSGKTILPPLANRCITSAFQPYAKKYWTQANCYKCELSFVLFNSAPVVLTGWHCTDRMVSRLLLVAQFCISPNHCQDYLWNSKQHCSCSATVLIKVVVVRVLAGQGVCVCVRFFLPLSPLCSIFGLLS